MTRLNVSLSDCHPDRFARQLKVALEHLPPGTLPLAQATTQGGLVDDSDISVTVVAVHDDGDFIRARVMVFFSEIVGGCSCGDDPLSSTAQGELEVSIERRSGQAAFTVPSP
jgi:hypothetical protein